MHGHHQNECFHKIGTKASTKFWDRQTSLEREDLELGASVSQTNFDDVRAANNEAFIDANAEITNSASMKNNINNNNRSTHFTGVCFLLNGFCVLNF